MADRDRRLVQRLRGWRSQTLPGYSDNGYSALLMILVPVWLVPSVWLDRYLGTDWITLVAGFVWAVAVVVSIVVATRDDAREGTGRWYGKVGFFNTGRIEALTRTQKAGRIETAPTSVPMPEITTSVAESASAEPESQATTWTRDTAAGSVWWTAADAAAGEPGKDRMPEVADPADAERPQTGD